MLSEGLERLCRAAQYRHDLQAGRMDLGAHLALLVRFSFTHLPGLRQHLGIVHQLCLQEVCGLGMLPAPHSQHHIYLGATLNIFFFVKRQIFSRKALNSLFTGCSVRAQTWIASLGSHLPFSRAISPPSLPTLWCPSPAMYPQFAAVLKMIRSFKQEPGKHRKARISLSSQQSGFTLFICCEPQAVKGQLCALSQ